VPITLSYFLSCAIKVSSIAALALINQKQQNPQWFDRLLNRVRERIEGSFNELQNTGRNLERLLAKTVIGLSTRVIAKVTSYTLKQLLRDSFGLDVQTFQVAEA
jgi:hypothetical protein